MSREFQIVLPGNREGGLRVPEPFSAEDLRQVQAWLEFNKDLLIDEDREGASDAGD